MKIKTNELTGAALDWAVAKCEFEGCEDWDGTLEGVDCVSDLQGLAYSPSTDLAQGGPIIEREQLNLACLGEVWEAWPNTGMNDAIYCKGPTPLIAAMRCHVASKLGDIVEIPEAL